LANYTIGQRKGLGVASPVPLYVITKERDAQCVDRWHDEEMGVTELTRDVNWVSGETPSEPFHADVKIRYTAKEVGAWVMPHGRRIKHPSSLMRLCGMRRRVRRRYFM
jgi:tRNA-uridine 2-sulfurtransferase